MAQPPRAKPEHRIVRATIDLLHQVHEGKELFAIPALEGLVGPCDGKMDGTPCGVGCTCRAGQPWYDEDRIMTLGFRPEPRG